MPIGLIVGVAVGGFVLILILACIIYKCCCKKKTSEDKAVSIKSNDLQSNNTPASGHNLQDYPEYLEPQVGYPRKPAELSAVNQYPAL